MVAATADQVGQEELVPVGATSDWEALFVPGWAGRAWITARLELCVIANR